jgi:hypothetical protein
MAPGRFSTTTGWPRRCDSAGTMARTSTSPPPPAAQGMMILIGLVGKLLDCAQAVGARPANAPAVNAPITRRREGCCFMFCLLVCVESGLN